MSRKGSYWVELLSSQAKTPSYSILSSRPGPALGYSTVSPIDAWKLFMCDNIIEELLTYTNMQGQRVATDRGKEWKNVTKHELMAFIGSTILAGSEKNWDVPVHVFFGSRLTQSLTHCTRPLCQFKDLKIFAVSCSLMSRGPQPTD